MSRTYCIRVTCIIFLFGVALGSRVLDEQWYSLSRPYFFISVLAVLLLWGMLRKPLLLFTFALVFGLWYVGTRYAPYAEAAAPTGEMSMLGRVEFVDLYIDKQRLSVTAVEPVELAGRRLFVYARRYPRVYEGAQIAFRCSLGTAEPIENFAFDKYAARRGIHFQCLYPFIEVVKPPVGFRAVLSRIKEFYSDQYTTLFHEPESTLAKAMMLARYQEMPQTLRTAYSRAGISHVISISGLHISIIALIFDTMLIAVGGSRRLRAVFLLAGLSLYLIVLGFPAPAVRSVIMALLIVLSRIIGRPYNIFHGLLLTATAMILANPMVLLFDIGFQLSFLALAGVAFTGEALPLFLTWIPEAFQLRSLVSMTLGAKLLTWPLIMYYFGIFSIVAPLSNIAIVALLVPILVSGLAVPLLAPLPALQMFVSWPFYFMLRAMTEVARWSAALPYAAFAIDNFSVGYLVLSYLLTGALLFWMRKRSKVVPSELPWYVR